MVMVGRGGGVDSGVSHTHDVAHSLSFRTLIAWMIA